jgi:hypothetical protein
LRRRRSKTAGAAMHFHRDFAGPDLAGNLFPEMTSQRRA